MNSAVVTAHVCATAKAVREKEDVGIFSSRYRQGPKIVNTDGNARAVGQGVGRTASELSGGRSYAPDEAAGDPLFRADFHAEPPVKKFKHCEGAHNTEMTEGIGVACVHDPRSGQK